jgi:TolB-like protein/tetratricopeptide (TPR) repeat protein
MSKDVSPTDPKPPSVDRVVDVWRRIHENTVVQWTVAYVALAYAIQHAVILTSESFEWPNIVARISMLLFALGLPLVVTLAWYHGHRAHRHFSRAEVTIIATLFVTATIVFYVFVRPMETATASASAGSAEIGNADAGAKAETKSATPSAALSVAVLPFENLSPDKEQEYFSDGMTEEITSALAKARVRVIGRASSFQFKGQNRDLRAIGQALSVTHLLEGSVRRAGNRLRITAELVAAGNGVTLWSDSYDRDLTDVFAIQEDIAKAIVAALKVPLGLAQGELLVSNRTIDPESYDEFLRARVAVFTREPQKATNAVSLLEKITAREPNYAPAWALLALAYGLNPQDMAWYSGVVSDLRRVGNDSLPKAEAAALHAIKLDANLPEAYTSLGRLQVARGNLLMAEEAYAKALALDPNNPDTLLFYGNLRAEVGHLKEALDLMQKLRVVEPLVPLHNLNAAVVIWLNGQTDSATGIMESLPPGAARNIDLSEIYASEGRYRDAAAELQNMPEGTFLPGIVEEAQRLLRQAPANATAVGTLPRLGRLGFAYLYVGAPLRALEFHEASVDAGFAIAITMAELWHPSYALVRKTERFKTFVRKAGFVDYWRAKGWPVLCHPIGGDDFACE